MKITKYPERNISLITGCPVIGKGWTEGEAELLHTEFISLIGTGCFSGSRIPSTISVGSITLHHVVFNSYEVKYSYAGGENGRMTYHVTFSVDSISINPAPMHKRPFKIRSRE